ncbi:MAG: PEGA domain-containing protein [Myxococcaceae bacterium]
MRAPFLVLAACVATVSSAATPPPTARDIGSLLIPMDQGAEVFAPRVEGYMNGALENFPGFAVKKPEALFGMPVDEAATAAWKRAEKAWEDGRQSFVANKYEDAERKLRSAIKAYGLAAAAMTACAHLCDATAYYAAALHRRGDLEEAKIVLLDLLALQPNHEFSKDVFSQSFLHFRGLSMRDVHASLRGSLTIRTRPAGARVYLDGQLVGHTPFQSGALAMGKHWVRLERPGYRVRGEIVEVSPDEKSLSADLVPTPLFRRYLATQRELGAEVLQPQVGPALAATAKALGLNRVVLGTLKQLRNDGGNELVLGLFDLRSGKRLADRKAVFQGDEFGQLGAEVERNVTALVNAGGFQREKVTKTRDPLDSSSGTDEWSGEDRGGRGATHEAKTKRLGGDPLEGSSGTEDW